MTTQRFICVHGHFYQPPRESAWLEAIEAQPSAYPYHDWNERVDDECYAPNTQSRVLNGDGAIADLVNNYAHVSFDMGPTLLSWMERHAPGAYAAILEADRESRRRFSGHGAAIAQAYNHIIMPLATRRDRVTQVVWGIRDFSARFGRDPEGMWLPEAAVENETLAILADHGIRFVILAPRQAQRVRSLDSLLWLDVGESTVDPKQPYRVWLPGGQQITAFFYDGPASQAVAFENLLLTGERFAERLLNGFDRDNPRPQLMHIATDGETYGHHHRFGDMALAYMLRYVQQRGLAKLTVYGEYLDHHPPTHEAQVRENTSWSCSHGIERWRSDCGCKDGGHPTWHQRWRRPLRDALDWLRDQIAPAYEAQAATLLRESWAARDAYVDVVVRRDEASLTRFLRYHAGHVLTDGERSRVLRLLEMQRHAMLMFASDAWFFDDLARVEPVQAMRHAARVIELARDELGLDLEDGFLRELADAASNDPRHGDARQIYERMVRPETVDLPRAAAHYAISKAMGLLTTEPSFYTYAVDQADAVTAASGPVRLMSGTARLRSTLTAEQRTYNFGVLHDGRLGIHCGVRPSDERNSIGLRSEGDALMTAFEAGYDAALSALRLRFGNGLYRIDAVFPDERAVLVERLAAGAMTSDLSDGKSPLRTLGVPLAPNLQPIGALALNARAHALLREPDIDAEAFRSVVAQAALWGVRFDQEGLAHALSKHIAALLERLRTAPLDTDALSSALNCARLAWQLGWPVRLWRPQNTYWLLSREPLAEQENHAASGDRVAAQWAHDFRSLGRALHMR
ncbi:MAG: DUF3536 domain-containing protein [SAR202 cluster bacterium]|nr:DUF3536 domain-containing protein [SAR202 cluster bacterium]